MSTAEYNREYYKKHKERLRKGSRKRYWENREYRLEYHRSAEYKAKRNLRRRKNRRFVNRVKLWFGCSKCGYKKSARALEFHHPEKDNATKRFKGIECDEGCSITTIKAQIRQRVLLCSNCHRECHDPRMG